MVHEDDLTEKDTEEGLQEFKNKFSTCTVVKRDGRGNLIPFDVKY